jgi:hypothetical protein
MSKKTGRGGGFIGGGIVYSGGGQEEGDPVDENGGIPISS